MMYNTKHQEMKKEAINDIIEALENGFDAYYVDLHNEVFNSDYYVVYTHQARELLNQYDVFDAIDLIRDYELNAYGETYTDFSDPVQLANMLYFVIGEEVIDNMYSDIPEFQEKWDESTDEETNKIVIQKLKELYNM